MCETEVPSGHQPQVAIPVVVPVVVDVETVVVEVAQVDVVAIGVHAVSPLPSMPPNVESQ